MTTCPPTFLSYIFLPVFLFLTSPVYADAYIPVNQNHTGWYQEETTYEQGKQAAREQLEDVLISSIIGELLDYELGANYTSGVKLHTSIHLKMRSDETILQFKVKF